MKTKSLFMSLAMVIIIPLTSCKKDLKDIIAETKQATFTVYTYDEYGSPSGSGSGFFIDENGTAITNFHVLDGSTKAVIKTEDGVEYEIDQVVASDEKWDIAKFTIKNKTRKDFQYLTFTDKVVEQGDKVYNISAPLGLEHTVSEGIVSSLRSDSHGKVIQITAPISPGSSGSAILDEQGKVMAVATFQKRGGQNLNFGVSIDTDRLVMLTQNDFLKKYPNFNKKDNFIILNIPDEGDGDVTLHALEFKPDATIAYLSYTNLDMAYESLVIWCELNAGDESFTIKDKDRNKKYHVVSSTIGVDKASGTDVALASNYRFKVYFPAIKDELNNIDIATGTTTRDWKFPNISLNQYREKIAYDSEKYIKEYAYSTMHKGDLEEAVSIFSSILEETPEDVQALNAMGIISYVIDNNMDALHYFSKAIETHPNNTLGLHNRSYLYKHQKEYAKALDDISKVISIDAAQPDNYYFRAMIYVEQEKYEEAIKDFSKALDSVDFKEESLIYFYRALCYAQVGKIQKAKDDVQAAYNYTNDSEMETMLQDLWVKLHQ